MLRDSEVLLKYQLKLASQRFQALSAAGVNIWLLEVMVDEFQLIQEQAAELGWSEPIQRRLCKDLVYELGFFAASDQGTHTHASGLRMVLQPTFFGLSIAS